MTEQPILESPRLARLQHDLRIGNNAALSSFWLEIAEQGTPLVEAVAEDLADYLVTFLWRAVEGTRRVSLYASAIPSAGSDPEPLIQLPGTDLWYCTRRFPRELRTRYGFHIDDQPLQPDPLARRSILLPAVEGTSDSPLTITLVELPDAPAQTWSVSHPDTPRGTISHSIFKSAILGNERRVWVYCPPGYTAAGPVYDLALIFDGWALQLAPPTPTILDNLLAAGRIPPHVAVFIDNPSDEARTQELPCHQPFVDFLSDELLPWIREHYHVTRDPAQTTAAGVSFGGLAAAYAALRRPDLFGNVLSLSGSFYWQYQGDAEPESIARELVERPSLPLRFYLSVGIYETFFRGPQVPTLLTANRHLRDVLQAKGYDLRYEEYAGGHDFTCWPGPMADGLIALASPQSR